VKYGLSIYPLFEDDYRTRKTFFTMVATAFPVQYAQIETAWQTLRNYPDFNNVQIHRRSTGDLVIEVYYSPLDIPKDADCVFHAKISPSGSYS
jgi:hypothetical protein